MTLAPGASGPPSVPELIPVRMLNEVTYCPRLMYLEWVQGEFRDNEYTVHGRAVHKRADKHGGTLPRPPGGATEPAGAEQAEGDPMPAVARSVWLSSESLGITGKIDVVEGGDHGSVIPIEYKRGRVPNVPERAYLPERVQLCAQVLLLREHGYTCERADIYFAADRRRVSIDMNGELMDATRQAIAEARRIAGEPMPPPPLDNSPKCQGCSLAPICLPDELCFLTHDQPGVEPRSLQPARDDALPLYVQEHGARVGVSGPCLRVTGKNGDVVEARLPHTSQVSLFGYAQISTQALHALFRRQIPVCFFTGGNRFVGQAGGMPHKNVALRVAQHRAADRPAACLRLARGMVASKIHNCRILLRRNSDMADRQALEALARAIRRAGEAESLAELLGIEGTAARVYFGAFATMLKSDDARALAAEFERRNRRPPRDPINALLSFGYALLAKDLTITAAAVGFDPMRGFYHQMRFGRPALALDLMEEFRPLVADSVVVSVLNNGEIGARDFDRSPVAVMLSSAARKRFLRAYERRMNHAITHPVFGYKISYRRVLEVQARLLGRYLLGEIPEYPRFNTR